LDDGGKVHVGPDRAVPLSRLASRFPRVEKEIYGLKKKRELEKRSTDIEYWLLYKTDSPGKGAVKNKRLQKLLALLEDGPLSLTEILKKMDVYHALQLNATPLLQRGIIERATLTPTDLLHVNGQMDTWCVEAARQAVEYACTLHANNPLNFVKETLNLMVASMVEEAIVFLGGQVEDDNLPDRVDGSWGRWLVREAFTGNNSYLQVTIASRYPIIGIGAPAEIFISRVAELMHTRFILPNHAPVGNAVGAVAGSVIVEKEAIVYPRESRGTCIHVVQIEGENTDFSEDEDAIDYAVQTVTNLAQAGAVAAGAVTPQVIVEKSVEGNLNRIVARGIGNPKL
jgi:N-methylhydantoinase A/oxoprolinase/acetone carboxylase beta subunit